MLPATSDRHLSIFKTDDLSAAYDAFGSNFSCAPFCLGQPFGGLVIINEAPAESWTPLFCVLCAMHDGTSVSEGGL